MDQQHAVMDSEMEEIFSGLGRNKRGIGPENGSNDASAKRSCHQQGELSTRHEDSEAENNTTIQIEGNQDSGDEAVGNDMPAENEEQIYQREMPPVETLFSQFLTQQNMEIVPKNKVDNMKRLLEEREQRIIQLQANAKENEETCNNLKNNLLGARKKLSKLDEERKKAVEEVKSLSKSHQQFSEFVCKLQKISSFQCRANQDQEPGNELLSTNNLESIYDHIEGHYNQWNTSQLELAKRFAHLAEEISKLCPNFHITASSDFESMDISTKKGKNEKGKEEEDPNHVLPDRFRGYRCKDCGKTFPFEERAKLRFTVHQIEEHKRPFVVHTVNE